MGTVTRGSVLDLMADEEWTAEEVASLLRISASNVRNDLLRLLAEGKVDRRRLGNSWVYRRAGVTAGPHIHRCRCGARWDEEVA